MENSTQDRPFSELTTDTLLGMMRGAMEAGQWDIALQIGRILDGQE